MSPEKQPDAAGWRARLKESETLEEGVGVSPHLWQTLEARLQKKDSRKGHGPIIYRIAAAVLLLIVSARMMFTHDVPPAPMVEKRTYPEANTARTLPRDTISARNIFKGLEPEAGASSFSTVIRSTKTRKQHIPPAMLPQDTGTIAVLDTVQFQAPPLAAAPASSDVAADKPILRRVIHINEITEDSGPEYMTGTLKSRKIEFFKHRNRTTNAVTLTSTELVKVKISPSN